MDAATLLDALVAAGMLFALGIVIAVGGRAGDPAQRTIGGFISASGLTLALVSAGNWHHTMAGQAVASALLVIVGAAALVIPKLAGPAELSCTAEQRADDEVRP